MRRVFSLKEIVASAVYEAIPVRGLAEGSIVRFGGRIWRVVSLDIDRDRVVLED